MPRIIVVNAQTTEAPEAPAIPVQQNDNGSPTNQDGE